MKQRSIKCRNPGWKMPLTFSEKNLGEFAQSFECFPADVMDEFFPEKLADTTYYARLIMRMQVYRNGCIRALSLPGSLVDFGVYHGLFSHLFHMSEDISVFGKKHYLFDTWGDDPGYDDFKDWNHYKKDIYSSVVDRFSKFKGVELVRGLLPKSAEGVVGSLSAISFACIDVNSQSLLERDLTYMIWDKMSSGAMLYLDDYAFLGMPPEFGKWCFEFSQQVKSPLFELPSGSAFILKN
jgi:hypothetical protein